MRISVKTIKSFREEGMSIREARKAAVKADILDRASNLRYKQAEYGDLGEALESLIKDIVEELT